MTGEDRSSEEDHDISYERDGWKYAPRARNMSRPSSFPSSTLMNILAMIANGLGRQQATTPPTEDCDPSVPNVRPSSQGSGQLSPSQSQQQVLRPPQGLSDPYSKEKATTTEGSSQPYRPQGGWGVQLMDPALVTQLQG